MTAPAPRAPAHDPSWSARLTLLQLALVGQVITGHIAAIGYPPIPALDPTRLADRWVLGWRLLTRFGPQAAVVFVVLSGTMLVPQLRGLVDRGAPVAPWLRRRLARIAPVLVLALVLTALCDPLGWALPGGHARYAHVFVYDAVAAYNGPAFIGNLLALEPTFAGAFGSNAPLWTLGYLVQFYLCGALLVRTARTHRGLAGVILAGMIAGGGWWQAEWAVLFVLWLGGGLVAALPRPSLPLALGLAMTGTAVLVLANRLALLPGLVVAGIGGAALIHTMAVVSPIPARLPRWLASLGAAAYPLYALHMPLLVLAFSALASRFDPATLALRLLWPTLALTLVNAAAIAAHHTLRRVTGR